MKVLWGTTKCENKKLIFVLIRINEMHGAWRVNDDILQPRYIKFFWVKNQRHIHNPVKHLTGSFCGNSSRLKNNLLASPDRAHPDRRRMERITKDYLEGLIQELNFGGGNRPLRAFNPNSGLKFYMLTARMSLVFKYIFWLL